MILNCFHLAKQKRSNTCGYATAGMILSFLEDQCIDEDYLLANDPFDAFGITFRKLMEVYRKYLQKHSAEIVYGDIDKMSALIENSLQSGIPLHIQYLTEDLMGDRKPVLHYAALIGYDAAAESYSVADPYGSIRTIKKKVFFNAVSFRNECLPDLIKQKYPSHMMIAFQPR
ncbi:MAG: C39 family peptidase [Eubacteriales bacterium]|nr:C39 family peptidase [Eubacteriales bacterium]